MNLNKESPIKQLVQKSQWQIVNLIFERCSEKSELAQQLLKACAENFDKEIVNAQSNLINELLSFAMVHLEEFPNTY